MGELLYRLQEKIPLSKINIFKKDIVFTLSLVLALMSCMFYTPQLHFINFKVLVSLFNLMIVVKAFEELKLLDRLAIVILNKCSNSRKVSMMLILLCFFSSMLVTNDVALITFVPLTLIISKKTNILMLETIILQTIAANIGSSLTPMGNPQNLYIYSHYKLEPIEFFMTVFLLFFFGVLLLFILNHRLNNKSLEIELPVLKIHNPKKSIIWMIVFCFITASILGVLNYKLALIITLLTVFILDRKLLFKIDYYLLITFICFFIFIGNISKLKIISHYMIDHLNSTTSVYFNSIFFSQFISNVPASILLSKFTANWKPLLLGVNLGGLGTLIASLASVISYKLFIKEHPQENKKYLIKFSLYNFFGLLTLTFLTYLVF
ncbi:anion transporter [Bacillus sp. RG28]|uniref:Anion transporter n=1 Tax=Gottfriedia endophytica TaxID=2820819 RepID=A0A940NUQ6_9BACI|nr:SLC13 family permease [Gottfriedia endophytica]MBP0725218.1 anion transporter [Gottfriedia endophytica]